MRDARRISRGYLLLRRRRCVKLTLYSFGTEPSAVAGLSGTPLFATSRSTGASAGAPLLVRSRSSGARSLDNMVDSDCDGSASSAWETANWVNTGKRTSPSAARLLTPPADKSDADGFALVAMISARTAVSSSGWALTGSPPREGVVGSASNAVAATGFSAVVDGGVVGNTCVSAGGTAGGGGTAAAPPSTPASGGGGGDRRSIFRLASQFPSNPAAKEAVAIATRPANEAIAEVRSLRLGVISVAPRSGSYDHRCGR